jgi:hypothetical protein
MNVSKHITIEEATMSPTALRLGIDNVPSEKELESMKLVAEKCFEPLREWYGKPIKVNSFFRCKALNDAVGSNDRSYHRLGMAIDMGAGSKEENEKLYNWCRDNLKFTELINEYNFSWVHIAYNPNSLTNTLKKIG